MTKDFTIKKNQITHNNNMKILFWLVLKLKLKEKCWGDMFMKWHTKRVNKFIDSIDLDTSNIKIIKK